MHSNLGSSHFFCSGHLFCSVQEFRCPIGGTMDFEEDEDAWVRRVSSRIKSFNKQISDSSKEIVALGSRRYDLNLQPSFPGGL